jgi:hypothetical protein
MLKTLLKGLAMQVQTPVDWAIQHLQVLGWPVICVAVYKFARFLDRMQHRAAVVEENISNLTSNHFPHIQNSLESIDESLQRQEQRWDVWMTTQAAQKHDK